MDTELPRHPKTLIPKQKRLKAQISEIDKEIRRLEILLAREERKKDLREQKLGYLRGEELLFWTLITMKEPKS